MTKNETLALFQQNAISRLEVCYDGSCDEGCVTWVMCFGPDGAEVTPAPEINSLVEELVCDILADKQAGWELEDGSFGDVEIDVDTGSAQFSHTERVVEHFDEDFVVNLRGGN